MSSKKYLIGNWKMNLLPDAASDLVKKYDQHIQQINSSEVVVGVAPTNLAFQNVRNSSEHVWVGGQNAFFEESGAFTGDVSAQMLKSLAADFCLVGHSERRSVFNEAQSLITARAEGVLDVGLKLVYCFGETKEERDSGNFQRVIQEQLLPVLDLVNASNSSQLILAYEPVWAIGTGDVASIGDIINAETEITKITEGSDSKDAPLLYGGSVNSDNFSDIFAINGIDGALVGGASLKPQQFISLIDQASNL